MHAPDPEAIPLSTPQAIAYAEAVEQMSAASAAEPSARISYGDDRGQRLEIYAPPDAAGLPIVVFFHGGAWINGHLGWLRFMAPLITASPAVFIACTYRLAPRCRWPAQFDDARAAVECARLEAPRWGGDPERMVLSGHSAGGQLAALLALREQGAQACLPISAPLDLRYGEVSVHSAEGRVYKYLLADRAQDADASPLAYVSQSAPPFHLTWGENDLAHVARSNAAMARALAAAGAQVSTAIEERASHFDTHLALAEHSTPWYGALRRALAL